jgi:Sulfotransferase domain
VDTGVSARFGVLVDSSSIELECLAFMRLEAPQRHAKRRANFSRIAIETEVGLPHYRFSKTLSLVRKIQVYLRIEAGAARGTSPDDVQRTQQKLKAARRKIRRQRRKLAQAERRIRRLKRRTSSRGSPKTAKKGKGGTRRGPLPDFLIIGTEKGGTSFLYWSLCQHPLVEAAAKKEVHFFDAPKWLRKSIGWYRAQFPASTRKDGRRVITGEASPFYLFHPLAPYRASRTVPNTKLIAVLRNPVDRAYSAYRHRVLAGQENLSFEEALEAEQKRTSGELEKLLSDESYHSRPYTKYTYRLRGIYVEQLERWHEYFDPEQLLVLRSEDLFTNPTGTLWRVHEFLDLPKHDLDMTAAMNMRNKGSYEQPMNPITRRQLEEYFEPHNQRLYEYLGEDFGW